MSNKNHNSFCVAPWVHSHVDTTGKRRLCCVDSLFKTQDTKNMPLDEFYNSSFVKEVRKKMLSNEYVPECDYCNNKTNRSHPSARDTFNREYFHQIKSIIKNTSEDGHYNSYPQSFDYRLTNKCNFRCIMCVPESSSLIERDYDLVGDPMLTGHKEQIIDDSFSQLLKEEIYNSARLGLINRMYWTGGEPFLWKEHYEIIDNLINKYNVAHKILIEYSTNLSVITFNQKNIMDLLSKFKSYNLELSLDGVNEVGEFIRRGMSWEKWLKNYKEIKSKKAENGEILINTTISTVSLIGLKDLIDFIQQEKLKINLQQYIATSCRDILSPLSLPRETLEKKCNEIQSYIFNKYPNEDVLTPIIYFFENLKKEKTFEEIFGVDIFKREQALGKKRVLALEEVRDNKNKSNTYDNLFKRDKEISDWWEQL